MDKEKLRAMLVSLLEVISVNDCYGIPLGLDNDEISFYVDKFMAELPQADQEKRFDVYYEVDKRGTPCQDTYNEPSPDLVGQVARDEITELIDFVCEGQCDTCKYFHGEIEDEIICTLPLCKTDYIISLIRPSIKKEARKQLIKELADEGIWGQVKVFDLEKGDTEWTMWCFGEKFWESLSKEVGE
uniref:Uncharacterized protein n=1 Tax=viral metagenome TaxID=1070528 RepID=A0A6M3LME6_9ZZZZ